MALTGDRLFYSGSGAKPYLPFSPTVVQLGSVYLTPGPFSLQRPNSGRAGFAMVFISPAALGLHFSTPFLSLQTLSLPWLVTVTFSCCCSDSSSFPVCSPEKDDRRMSAGPPSKVEGELRDLPGVLSGIRFSWLVSDATFSGVTCPITEPFTLTFRPSQANWARNSPELGLKSTPASLLALLIQPVSSVRSSVSTSPGPLPALLHFRPKPSTSTPLKSVLAVPEVGVSSVPPPSFDDDLIEPLSVPRCAGPPLAKTFSTPCSAFFAWAPAAKSTPNARAATKHSPRTVNRFI